MLEQLLWVILPYIAITIFIGGHIFRYNYDQFGWTTKSSEFLENRLLRVGSLLFHWGIIFVFFGHIAGLVIPIQFYETLGISSDQYHLIALTGGIPAGIATIIGLIILMYRRFSIKRIIKTSTKSDYLALIFLAIVIFSGMAATLFNIDSQGFDYRTTIAPWLRGLVIFNPDPSLLATVPIWFKIHMIGAFGLFATWPFTRLVHLFSLPLRYLTRSYIIYRKRRPSGNLSRN